MDIRPATTVLITTLIATLSDPALSQDHEPMLVVEGERFTSTIAGHAAADPLDFDRHEARTALDGPWGGQSSSASRDVFTAAAQWTAIREDWMGGFFHAAAMVDGRPEGESHSGLDVTFSVERTGILRLRTRMDGDTNHLPREIQGLARVRPAAGECCSALHRHTIDPNGSVTPPDETTILIRPGRYRFYAGAHILMDAPSNSEQVTDSTIDFFAELAVDRLPDCGEPGAGSCIEAKETPSCEDATCCDLICRFDPYCCDNQWDKICADQALASCASPCEGDLNWDGHVDFRDWSLLAVVAVEGSAEGPTSYDLDGNGVIDMQDLLRIYSLFGEC